MITWIALLRGINVGGRNKLPMKALVGLLENLGCEDVKTYIQSGNVVFRSRRNRNAGLEADISSEIGKQYGFEPRVLLVRLEDLESVIAANPFPEAEEDPKFLHVGFLASRPEKPKLDKLKEFSAETERFKIADSAFYLHAPEGIGRSRLAQNAERLIGVAMTDRNWRTVLKLREMAESICE